MIINAKHYWWFIYMFEQNVAQRECVLDLILVMLELSTTSPSALLNVVGPNATGVFLNAQNDGECAYL